MTLSSGPVVAGIIGTSKLYYDIWSDAVNTASRMEMFGVDGEIQVSESFYKALRGDFLLESRGELEIKGKGQMKTYFLRGKHDIVMRIAHMCTGRVQKMIRSPSNAVAGLQQRDKTRSMSGSHSLKAMVAVKSSGDSKLDIANDIVTGDIEDAMSSYEMNKHNWKVSILY